GMPPPSTLTPIAGAPASVATPTPTPTPTASASASASAQASGSAPGAKQDGAPGSTRARLSHLVRHGLQVAVANAVIAGLILLMHGGSWLPTAVYSQCIGLSCWALIEAGRLVLPLDEDGAWPRGWRTPALLATACSIGYVCGRTLADAILGESSWRALLASPRDLLGDMAFTVVFGAIVLGWFFARARSQAHAARLAAMHHEATLAHLALLQSQLEPHMLFNTLANLRALIAADPARAQDMLDRLIAFLRATLVASRSGPQSLASEFARLEDYLALMQVRMGTRLRVTLALPPDLAQASVPPLLLQPLVENAIKHGLEPRRGPGELEVSAERDGLALVLRVEDGGPALGGSGANRGMDGSIEGNFDSSSTNSGTNGGTHSSTHSSTNGSTNGSTHGSTHGSTDYGASGSANGGRSRASDASTVAGTGFGLAQVRERLRRLHGDAASLTLAPGRRDGWCAEIRLPLAWAGLEPEGAR
ncbi:MAG TPA: histidine kinase, partial [Burkholderiaceae bacterium]|nr:histidine kinase [Burkholderiaceae bacterium]